MERFFRDVILLALSRKLCRIFFLRICLGISSEFSVALLEGPLVYPYPQNTRNPDHGLSFFPPQKLRPWSEFLVSPINTESGVV